MASYAELHSLHGNVELLNKVMAAVAIAADAIRAEDPGTLNHPERVLWAKIALRNVDGTARSLMWLLIAQNKDYTLAQIEGATDAAIQAAVDSAVELLL